MARFDEYMALVNSGITVEFGDDLLYVHSFGEPETITAIWETPLVGEEHPQGHIPPLWVDATQFLEGTPIKGDEVVDGDRRYKVIDITTEPGAYTLALQLIESYD